MIVVHPGAVVVAHFIDLPTTGEFSIDRIQELIELDGMVLAADREADGAGDGIEGGNCLLEVKGAVQLRPTATLCLPPKYPDSASSGWFFPMKPPLRSIALTLVAAMIPPAGTAPE